MIRGVIIKLPRMRDIMGKWSITWHHSCERTMAINGNTKGLKTIPPRWVSSQLLYVGVSARWRSRWCSQNLRRPFLWAVRFLLYYIMWNNVYFYQECNYSSSFIANRSQSASSISVNSARGNYSAGHFLLLSGLFHGSEKFPCLTANFAKWNNPWLQYTGCESN